MKKIYIVQGSSGEYSDREEWLVCAYVNQQQAENHVLKATARAKELYAQIPDRWSSSQILAGANEYDPAMRTHYAGTIYYVGETTLDEEE